MLHRPMLRRLLQMAVASSEKPCTDNAEVSLPVDEIMPSSRQHREPLQRRNLEERPVSVGAVACPEQHV